MTLASDPFDLVGTVVAEKYRIDVVLGEGGYGVVYGGEHLLLTAPIALKCMKSLGATADMEERATRLFLREARVLFELSHPGIVRMYDVGTLSRGERSVPWVVLERVPGHSLDVELERRGDGTPFSRDEIVAVIVPVLEALAFAHARGVAHRDLKPSNLVLQPQPDGRLQVKVLDFGVASWAGEQRTPSGLTGFTPAYAAPEQWDEDLQLSGPASDVFSMGLILAELCTLSPVFPFTSPARILRAILDPARRIEVLGARPDLPPGLDALVARATDVDPEVRYRDASELLAAFREIFSGDGEASPKFAPAKPKARTVPARAPFGGISPSTVTPSTAVPVTRSASAELSRRVPWVLAVGGLALAGATYWRTLPPASDPATSQPPSEPAAASAAPSAEAFPEAVVALNALTAGSQYTGHKLDDALKQALPGVRACYLAALARDPNIAGRALLLVAVTSTGDVHSVADIDEASYVERVARDPELRGCVRGRASGLRLPAHDKKDLAGLVLIAELQPRARPGIPPARELGPDVDEPFTSKFVNKSTGEHYTPTQALVRRRGDVVSLEYPDGAIGCVVYGNKDLTCRWLQTDYQGGSAVVPKLGGGLEGTWGYWPSDSDGGPWSLAPRKP